MFLRAFVLLNTFALGMVVGVLTQRDVKGLPNLSLGGLFSKSKAPVLAGRLTVRTTAYCHLQNEPGAVGNLNCLGTELRYDSEMRSAAADWSRFPVGTQFRINDEPHLYEIDDYGSALVGTDTIDLYKPTLEMMKEWGAREVEITIVRMGSFQRSAEIMAPRMQYPHVAEMYRCLMPYILK